MKYKITPIILVLSISLSVYTQTDLSSYGYKGRVKAVVYRIYNEASFDTDGKFIDEKKQPYIEKILYFDKIGNIDSVVEVLSEGKFFEKYITYHTHSGNKIRSTIKYRYYTNEVIEEMKYSWSDKNSKCSFKGVGISKMVSGYRILAYNHRENKGEYMIETKRGVLLLKESYKNEFDAHWNLIKTYYSNAQKGDYIIDYEYDEMDEMGNYTQVKLVYDDSKKLQRFIQKEFAYY